jgi:hypothetical protein
MCDNDVAVLRLEPSHRSHWPDHVCYLSPIPGVRGNVLGKSTKTREASLLERCQIRKQVGELPDGHGAAEVAHRRQLHPLQTVLDFWAGL